MVCLCIRELYFTVELYYDILLSKTAVASQGHDLEIGSIVYHLALLMKADAASKL